VRIPLGVDLEAFVPRPRALTAHGEALRLIDGRTIVDLTYKRTVAAA
jgi:hypothetical protein